MGLIGLSAYNRNACAQDREIELDVSSSYFPNQEADNYVAIVKVKSDWGYEVGIGSQIIEGTNPAYLAHLGYKYEAEGGMSVGFYVTPVYNTMVLGRITIGYKL